MEKREFIGHRENLCKKISEKTGQSPITVSIKINNSKIIEFAKKLSAIEQNSRGRCITIGYLNKKL